MPELNTILKAGYNDKNASKELKKQNYILDKNLSNGNNYIYYNPVDKKIIHNVKGTNPFKFDDLKTDLIMGFGGLKNTDRYKDSKKILEQAKNKYKNYDVSITGHSLGSSIGEKIADKNKDKFFGLNGYFQPFKPTSNNNNKFQYFRTELDPISAFGANKKNVKTLTNKYNPTGILPLDLLNAHSVKSNDKNKIYV